MGECVLVTGAAGFIGHYLCAALQSQNVSVRALLHSDLQGSWDEQVVQDLTATAWAVNPCEGVSTVFHLAGKAHALADCSEEASEYHAVNVLGTQRLLEMAQAAGVERFIYLSSVKAAGECVNELGDEAITSLPNTVYGRSKKAAEELVLTGGYIPHVVVVRPCLVYGAGQKGNLLKMIRAISKGYFPPLPEFGNRRSMVHVDDLVRAVLLVSARAEANGECYIVSDGEAYSTRLIADWIYLALDKKPFPVAIPLTILRLLAKVGDIIGCCVGQRFVFDSDALAKLSGSSVFSSKKIKNELGFLPQKTVGSTMREMVSFLRH